MRLHRLEMVAFGPFAESTVVDFDSLGSDGLFLLHGQTGAGKTTVLDAIAFALFGRVPGARGESKRLHSDHAAANTPPRVDLEATLSGRTVRLTRSPEFERPKQRGTGFAKQAAKAILIWLDGSGENLSRIPDIGAEVTRLLGMSAEQFFQVALLPQGDFARFLRAENDEREKLLEKLFDTQRFGTAEQWLADKRRSSAGELDTNGRNVENLIVQVGMTAGIGATETIGPLEAVEWSQNLLATARTDLSAAVTELELRRTESARADAAVEQQRKLAELHRRLGEARRQLDAFTASAEQRAADRAELDRARRAEPVNAAIEEARTAVQTARHRDSAADRAAARLRELAEEKASRDIAGIDLIDTDIAAVGSSRSGDVIRSGDATRLREVTHPGNATRSGYATRSRDATHSRGSDLPGDSAFPGGSDLAGCSDLAGSSDHQGGFDHPEGSDCLGDSDHGPSRENDLDAAIRRWSAQLGTLDEVRSDATAASRVTAERDQLRARDNTLAETTTRLVRRRRDLPEHIRGAEARSQEATAAKAALPGLSAECERLQGAAAAAVELATRRTALDGARVDLESARGTYLNAKEYRLELRERRLAGMAAELAGRLTEGQPCVVCGALDHPTPARSSDDAVSKEAEDAAAAAEEDADRTRDRAAAALADIERDIESLATRAGDTDRAELAAALRTATDRYTDTADLAEQADTAAAALSRLRAEETQLHEELRATETEQGTVTAHIAAAETRLAELAERLRAAAGADPTIDRRRARLDSLVSAATDLRDNRAEATTAWIQAIASIARVENVARDAGLVSAGEASHAATTADVADAAHAVDATAVGTDPEAAATPARVNPTDTAPDEAIAVLDMYVSVVAEAARPARRQTELDEALVAADRARAHAEAVLAEPEIRTAADTEPGDLPAIQEAARLARNTVDEAVAAHAAASLRASGLEELSGQLWAAVDVIAPAQREHEELAALADVVAGRGANNRKMSLRSYVLAARLEEVALAGSVRLRRMSGNRYEFVHTDRAGSHGRRGGLGLDIRDDYTGAVRSAKTLSGGETFMAALALALGLADTVAADSGGVVLDTIFIDEGFGGLDADALDAVMGVLDELRAGGRVVGVVSHVDEMRQRIPCRLHVVRGRAGSHLRTTVA